jgi:hypothetical protein
LFFVGDNCCDDLAGVDTSEVSEEGLSGETTSIEDADVIGVENIHLGFGGHFRFWAVGLAIVLAEAHGFVIDRIIGEGAQDFFPPGGLMMGRGMVLGGELLFELGNFGFELS